MSCKKIKSSAVVGESLALSFAIVNPAAENTLSEGAEVAGIHKILLQDGHDWETGTGCPATMPTD